MINLKILSFEVYRIAERYAKRCATGRRYVAEGRYRGMEYKKIRRKSGFVFIRRNYECEVIRTFQTRKQIFGKKDLRRKVKKIHF